MTDNSSPDPARTAQLQVFHELLNLNPQLAAGMFQDNVIQNMFAQRQGGQQPPEAEVVVNEVPVVVEQQRPVEIPAPKMLQEPTPPAKEESENLRGAFKNRQDK